MNAIKMVVGGNPNAKKRMAPNVCGSLKHLLTLIVIIIQLFGLLNAGQPARSRARAAHAHRRSSHHQSDNNSGCDLLFAGNTGAQDFCQCRDSGASIDFAPDGASGELQPPAAPNDDLSSTAATATTIVISQLDCRHDNASELLGALARALAAAGQQQSSTRFKLDYLNIQTNVTYGDDELDQTAPGHQHLAQVDQLTATLTVTGSARASVVVANLLPMLVGRLFEPARLQSLTLVIIEEPYSEASSTKPTPPLKLNNFLEKLSSLGRLEISLSAADDQAHYPAWSTTLELNSTSLSAQAHSLQWLNLASNSRLNLTARPFARLSALEYLSMESNQLGAFHLYDHFAERSHPNLSTLNLAHNELSSLGRDLFCCSASHPTTTTTTTTTTTAKHHLFRLPSLSQLDLSHNRLTVVSSQEVHLILTSFPQLANLYLQHNQIVHLNLNALLGGPSWRHLAELRTFEEDAQNSTFHINAQRATISDHLETSKLELIDLSHNELVALTAFSQQHASEDNEPAMGPRVRSINLAHNRLRRPISLVNPKLVNLFVFDESIKMQQQQWPPSSPSIFGLNKFTGTIFDLTGAGGDNITSSLCDYLSFGSPLRFANKIAPDLHPATDDESFLTELLLGHNRLARLELGDFAGASCQRLETLALNDNSLAHIAPGGAFDSLTHLQRLDLSGNQLVEIPAGLFDHLSELQVLNLAGNKLTRSFTLPPLASHLHELYLQDNALESWQVSSNATSASALKILDLSHNKLAHLAPSAFNRLNDLTHLNLAGNKQLREFNWLVLFRTATASSSGSLASQTQELPRVDLIDHQNDKSDRKIKKLKKGVAQRVETGDRRAQRRRSARSSAASQMLDDDDELDYSQSAGSSSSGVISLRGNRLVTFGEPPPPPPPLVVSATAIRCDSLAPTLQVIRVLDLSHNWIRELGNNSFACFRQLELLDLSSNQLRILNELALEQLTQLRHLLVGNNYLVHVNGNLLGEGRILPKLRRLDLSQNQLSSLSLPPAVGPRQLEHLNLSDNYDLKLDSSELLALLRSMSSGALRQLQMARIASVWTNQILANDSALLKLDLELDSLDLGQVSRIDSNFWKYLASGRLRVEKLALCPPARENFTLAKLFGDDAKSVRQLDLSRCQLTSSMLKRAFEIPDATGGGGSRASENDGAPSPPPHITRLDLSHNKLSDWPPPPVSWLVHLDLSHNKLAGRLFRSEKHAPAVNLSQLEYLNLSSNALTSFCGEENANDNKCQQVAATWWLPHGLRKLDLSHNKLIALPGDLFDQWPHLEMVWLSHNRLALVAAPPNGGHGQQLALASRLRLLDLSFNEPTTSGFRLSSPAESQMDARQDEIGGEPLPPLIIARDLIIHKDEERAVIGCSRASDFMRNSAGRSSVHAITRWAESEDYFVHDDQQQPSGQVEKGVVTCSKLRELKLDNFTWSGLDLGATSSPVALSSTGSQIRTIGEINSRLTARSRATVIYLDLAHNAIESSFALDEICVHFPNLQTLELARQTNLQEVSLHHLTGDVHSVPPPAVQTCTRLAYVNLSHNKLRLIKLGPKRVNQTTTLDSVLVLRLDHNHLRDFSDDLLVSLPNLRHLDLRANQIVQLDKILTRASLTNPLLDMILDQQHPPPPPVSRFEVQVTRDMGALKIGSTAPTNQTFALEVSSLLVGRPGGPLASSQLNHQTSHVLRFCTLNRVGLYKVCLSQHQQELAAQQPVCFALRPPPRGPSCTTNIADQDQRAYDSFQTRTESLMSSDTNKTISTPLVLDDGSGPHDDPVLSFIDQLKWAWLRIKQFDLAAYLAQVSQVKQDSVLVTINGRHPIYTLTVIKLGLVLAALCVILLSIAMFALLTATVISGGGGSVASGKRQKLRRQNKVSDQESVESSYEQAASRAGSGKGDDGDDETTTIKGGGGGGVSATKSQDSSEGSRYSRRTIATTSGSSATGTGTETETGTSGNSGTVREVGHRLQVVATAATTPSETSDGHYHLFQHNASTPSSSLAPSSVETGETMQAVDSLQSCSFTRAQRQQIYDSQRTLTAASGHAHFNSVDQYQQQTTSSTDATQVGVSPAPPPPPVATVMRMVKSSTFDGVGPSMALVDDLVSSGLASGPLHGAQPRQQQQQQQRDYYGTLRNQRQLYSIAGCNYSSLARPSPPARTRFGPQIATDASNRFPAEQRQNYVPAQSMSFNSNASELDPATLSLLSLNSQLSGGGGGNGHSANNGGGQLVGGEQVAPVAAATSLCQYHTRQQAMQRARDQQQQQQQQQQEQHRELLLLAEELRHRHHSSSVAAAAATTIGGNGTLFELDEELQLADWRSGCEQQGADYPLAPPPPPPPPSL